MKHDTRQKPDAVRRQLTTSLALAAVAGTALRASIAAAADTFPDKSLRLVVPFPAGGPTDIVARPLAFLLGQSLKQQVVVDNKGGAGGSIGADAVAKSAPDGYTLLMGTVGTQAINAALYKKLAYDPATDFTSIGLVASAPVAVVVNAQAPYANIAELIAAAKKAPGTVTFGSAGNGTPGHLAGELFARAAGITLKHVPYRGSAPAVIDLVGGQIPLMFDPVQSILSNVTAGRLRALAVTSRSRSPVLPQVPTLAESGLHDFEAEAWWGVFAPAKLPVAQAAMLRREVDRVTRSEAFREKLGNLGVSPVVPPQDLEGFLRSERDKWGKAVRESGASAD
jgi:tripartite-type tricarboxylate transporter receptor subunit TctC